MPLYMELEAKDSYAVEYMVYFKTPVIKANKNGNTCAIAIRIQIVLETCEPTCSGYLLC